MLQFFSVFYFPPIQSGQIFRMSLSNESLVHVNSIRIWGSSSSYIWPIFSTAHTVLFSWGALDCVPLLHNPLQESQISFRGKDSVFIIANRPFKVCLLCLVFSIWSLFLFLHRCGLIDFLLIYQVHSHFRFFVLALPYLDCSHQMFAWLCFPPPSNLFFKINFSVRVTTTKAILNCTRLVCFGFESFFIFKSRCMYCSTDEL